MHFFIKHGDFNVELRGDVKKSAIKISEAFPGEEIWVFALNRGRLCVLDGSITEEVKLEEHYDLSSYPERLRLAMNIEWDHCMVGKMTSFPEGAEATQQEMFPADPTKWRAYQRLRIGAAEEPDMQFFMQGQPLDLNAASLKAFTL